MPDPIRFWVPGLPAPGGSKKAFVNPRTGRVVVMDDCKRNGSWMDRVAAFASGACPAPIEGPVAFRFAFVLPRPKGHFGSGRNAGKVRASAPEYPTVKPDTTKLIRSTEDALKGITWSDDSQVVQQAASKTYGASPGVWVEVWPVATNQEGRA